MTFLYELYKKEGLSPIVISEFRALIYSYYSAHKRVFPWRTNPSHYNVFISEVMLQQTQAGSRTIDKFNEFIRNFPTFHSLATASLTELLCVWQGLGYNRRALGLKKAAEIIVNKYGGLLPSDLESLDALPGIGPATACSISAFAFNVPVVFIETNIRSLYLHHFFPGKQNVLDMELLPIIEATLDRPNSREWYSALMDYGSMLKKKVGNDNIRSKHYTKQSMFNGSDRQIRGKILKGLIDSPLSKELLFNLVPEERVYLIADRLVDEGFATYDGNLYSLKA